MRDLYVLGPFATPPHPVDHHVYHYRHHGIGTFAYKHFSPISYACKTFAVK